MYLQKTHFNKLKTNSHLLYDWENVDIKGHYNSLQSWDAYVLKNKKNAN